MEPIREMFQELQKFAIFIIRRFAETAEKNRKAYMELLFWKNTREATEMLEGYDVQVENKKVSSALWTEVEEDELRTLFMEHQTNKYTQGNKEIVFEVLFLHWRLDGGKWYENTTASIRWEIEHLCDSLFGYFSRENVLSVDLVWLGFDLILEDGIRVRLISFNFLLRPDSLTKIIQRSW